LRVDPGVLAFGPGVRPLPPGPVDPPPPPRTALDEFVAAARPAPPAADEALGWLQYEQVQARRQAMKAQVVGPLRLLLLRNVPRPSPLPVPADYLSRPIPPDEVPAAEAVWKSPGVDPVTFQAVPVLAVRAARRAIADDPAHPDGYTALAQALADPSLPISPSERQVGQITALRQALSRYPRPADFRRDAYRTSPYRAAANLARLYLGRQYAAELYRGVDIDLAGVRELVGEMLVVQRQGARRVPYQMMLGQGRPGAGTLIEGPLLLPLDLAQKALAEALEYAAVEHGPSSPPEVQNEIRGLDDLRKRLDALTRRQVDQYRAAAERVPRVRDRFRLAGQYNLAGERLDLLKELKGDDLAREFGPDAPGVAAEMVALEVAVGRLEDAAAHLAEVREALGPMATQTPPPPGVDRLRFILRLLEYQVQLLGGNYADAGRSLGEVDGRAVEATPPPDPPDVVLGPKGNPLFWPPVAVVGGVGRVADLGFWAANREVQFRMARQQVLGGMDGAAQYYFRRGWLALLAGEMAEAKAFFGQARRPAPPPGWGLPELVHVQAADLLGAIEAAEKRAAGR
ncbi:MAG: hypothetical protein K2X87_23745, partial [Gemmataceae bacterium]|nr:hypothetical protein [Gemmataceae bacterium]